MSHSLFHIGRYLSNQNGPHPPNSALLGQFSKSEIILLISLEVIVGTECFFVYPLTNIPDEWSKTPYIICTAQTLKVYSDVLF